MIYVGIGSRETPMEVLDIFERLGKWLAMKGNTLRSGHALGADTAFEIGCSSVNGAAEIYIPWKGFNNSTSNLILKPDDNASQIAQKYHPMFSTLSQGAKKLQARNSYQILGYSLDTPADFVLCWTDEGYGRGGTGQALRIAKAYNIPILDFGSFTSKDQMRQKFMSFYTEQKESLIEN